MAINQYKIRNVYHKLSASLPSGIMHLGRIPDFKLIDHGWQIKGKTNAGAPVFVRNF